MVKKSGENRKSSESGESGESGESADCDSLNTMSLANHPTADSPDPLDFFCEGGFGGIEADADANAGGGHFRPHDFGCVLHPVVFFKWQANGQIEFAAD